MQPADTQRTLPPGAPADLIGRLAAAFAAEPAVVAVALGGSRGGGGIGWDDASDLDLEVVTSGTLAPEARQRILRAAGAPDARPANPGFWGDADEWRDGATGILVDASYFDAAWLEDQLDRVLVRHLPSLGYSTCLWHTVRTCTPVHDPLGRLAALVRRAAVPYPGPLRRAVIAHNRAALRGFPSAWEEQVARAAGRRDAVAVNHRLAGLLASYVDILFALNRAPHPGEKRLLEAVTERCPERPPAALDDLEAILAIPATRATGLPDLVRHLLDDLDALLAGTSDRDEELLPAP